MTSPTDDAPDTVQSSDAPFVLSDRDAETVIALLEARPKPTPAMEELFMANPPALPPEIGAAIDARALPPEIEAVIDSINRSDFDYDDRLVAPERGRLASAIASALTAAREAGRRAVLEGSVDEPPVWLRSALMDVKMAADRRSGFVAACNRLYAAVAVAEARAAETARTQLWSAVLTDLRNAAGIDAAEGEPPVAEFNALLDQLRPVLSQNDAAELVDTYGAAVNKLIEFVEGPPTLDVLAERLTAARATLLVALTGVPQHGV